jgi:hypothetical protein
VPPWPPLPPPGPGFNPEAETSIVVLTMFTLFPANSEIGRLPVPLTSLFVNDRSPWNLNCAMPSSVIEAVNVVPFSDVTSTPPTVILSVSLLIRISDGGVATVA